MEERKERKVELNHPYHTWQLAAQVREQRNKRLYPAMCTICSLEGEGEKERKLAAVSGPV